MIIMNIDYKTGQSKNMLRYILIKYIIYGMYQVPTGNTTINYK